VNYQPNAAEPMFILEQVLHASAVLSELPQAADCDSALMGQVLEEAATFVGDVIAPLNPVGDSVGARFRDGNVTMPPGFRQAYQDFWQAGWPSLSAHADEGGQGLPAVLEAVLYEWLSAANHGWTMAPGLLHGAYECLKHHGSDALKARYLGRLATGEWLATMCLTEPHAGSDLGLARTRAVPQGDGSYAVAGTKIFISGGDHDLTDNIVHLVLARLPDAPAGPKGLSLFLVPKWYEDGTRSAVVCERIEEKMGLHGSPTCVMRFDEARAWMIGEAGKGLGAMFVMMNAARLHVALQGVGLLDAAWQKAAAYADERRQMRAPLSAGCLPMGHVAGQPDLIAAHPAVRRLLDTQRAWVDAGRVLAYRTALELDVAQHHPEPARRQQALQWCTLLTPILKAACTHQAFHGGSDCLQVLGGHGYVSEWGIEQHVRDARVAMIYEGTNEIQAIDLLIRKILPDGGQQWAAFLQQALDALPAEAASASALATTAHSRPHIARRFARLQSLAQRLTAQAGPHPALAYTVADDFLRAAAVALWSWAWALIAAAPETHTPRWTQPGQAYARFAVPEFDMRCAIVEAELQCAEAAAAETQG
jgi:alkylation response protein AidB-like acyl-CoA dehydrogenase